MKFKTTMPEHQLYINDWFKYIKNGGKLEPVKNEVRAGGVCYEDYLNELLEQAKNEL